jgi:4a-hydroxytetrahydrobiopterin dehydratase
MKDDGRREVKNALMNILFFPGLGSLRSGRRVAGASQLLLFLAGNALVLTWFFKVISQYYALMFGDEKPQSVAWIGECGGVLVVISWLWSCVTSLSLFGEASKPAPVPPRLSSTVNHVAPSPQARPASAALPGWQSDGQVISRTYEFADFAAAMVFVNAVAALAEQTQHHPDIDVRWNKVTLALTTHDAGGLTEKDFALAAACDACLP